MPHPTMLPFRRHIRRPLQTGRFSSIASVAAFHVTLHDSADKILILFGIQPFPV